jgi:hypothetical protein
MRRKKALLLALGVLCATVGARGAAAAPCTVPNQLTNGQTADATQVMANFNQLLTCLSLGQLTVPPVPGLTITSPGGGNATIQNPSSATNYNFNLPPGPGTAGQLLTSGGSAGTMSWTTAPSLTPPPLVDGIPVGRPAAASFSWMNQGGASFVEYGSGPITLTIPAQNGDENRGIGLPPPSAAPYTLTAKIDSLLWGANYFVAGVYIMDTTGKLLTFCYQTQIQGSSTAPDTISALHFNSPSSYNSTPLVKPVSASRTWWLRINNDGTKWNFSISHNGADWLAFYSEPLTTFLGSTIATLGVYGDNNDTTALGLSSFVSLWSFELVSGSGTNSSWQ